VSVAPKRIFWKNNAVNTHKSASLHLICPCVLRDFYGEFGIYLKSNLGILPNQQVAVYNLAFDSHQQPH